MSAADRRHPSHMIDHDQLTIATPPGAASSTVSYHADRNLRVARKSAPSQQRFPAPHIRPRQRRPHSIHIISYPPGYIPLDLRPHKENRQKQAKRRKTDPAQPSARSEGVAKRVRDTLFAPFARKEHSSLFSQIEPNSNRDPSSTPSTPSSSVTCTSAMVEAHRPPVVGGDTTALTFYKNGIISSHGLKDGATSSVREIPKPIASGSGVSCSILLAEPHLFLAGFDHDGRNRGRQHPNSTALLRGKLQLNVSKNVKIKSVTLKLSGKARTEWPEGIPPAKTKFFEESSLRTQVLTFFHALHDNWESPYGNQCVFAYRDGTPSPFSTHSSGPNFASLFGGGNSSAVNLSSPPPSRTTAKELKRLSLQSNQSRSFTKDNAPPAVVRPSVQVAKGFKVFYPGTYEYSFELPIDHHQLESIKLPFGSVKWELEAIVERAGAFKPNLHGTKEVSIVRVPDQLSLETTEPIVISRQWEDQLHYEIMISGKSFPIGSNIPVAFKLTPLAKVQVHKLKVLVTESVEYWTSDRRVARKDQARKLLLLEKAAGKPLERSKYPGCDVRVLSGGELSPEERREAREAAQRRRNAEGSRPLPPQSDNLLGDLDLGLESFWGSTEIEMNVQIPTCDIMRKDKNLKLYPDCSWKNVNVFHWIKIVMRISRVDEDDPTRQRRRHFEISIDSPITILHCCATHANTSLPEYPSPSSISTAPSPSHTTVCGCPDAAQMSAADTTACALSNRVDPALPRPIHFMRKPSFTPPAFDAEDPPPPISPLLPGHVTPLSLANLPAANAGRDIPMMTPPPCYDAIVGTPSVDGLADYFARLADYEYDDSSSSDGGSPRNSRDGSSNRPARLTERTGRVNVANPRSPGGLDGLLPSRSLELQRPIMLNLPTPRRS